MRPAISDFFPYLGFFFQTPFYRSNAAGRGKGIGINNLQKTALQSLYVPVPPLAEQHRIVAKVDELMALCDRLEADQTDAEAAHAQLVQALLDSLTQATDAADFRASWQRLSEHFHTLFTTEASIDALKQTVLQLAVMGKLVPNFTDDESASVLVARLRSNSVRLNTRRSVRTDVPLEQSDHQERRSIPGNWRWVRVGDICEVKGGKRLPAGATFSAEETPHVYIQVTNMKNGSIADNGLKYITSETRELIRNYTISRNDLYITIAGTIGDVGLVPDEFDGMNLTENAAKIVFSEIDKRWLWIALSRLRKYPTAKSTPQWRDALSA